MLQRVVKAIAENDGCAELQQNDWYLDDGILAETTSAVSRALDIIQNLGPDLGIHVNLQKCELFGKDKSFYNPILQYPTFQDFGSPSR